MQSAFIFSGSVMYVEVLVKELGLIMFLLWLFIMELARMTVGRM